jgi:hypothetical protein
MSSFFTYSTNCSDYKDFDNHNLIFLSQKSGMFKGITSKNKVTISNYFDYHTGKLKKLNEEIEFLNFRITGLEVKIFDLEQKYIMREHENINLKNRISYLEAKFSNLEFTFNYLMGQFNSVSQNTYPNLNKLNHIQNQNIPSYPNCNLNPNQVQNLNPMTNMLSQSPPQRNVNTNIIVQIPKPMTNMFSQNSIRSSSNMVGQNSTQIRYSSNNRSQNDILFNAANTNVRQTFNQPTGLNMNNKWTTRPY